MFLPALALLVSLADAAPESDGDGPAPPLHPAEAAGDAALADLAEGRPRAAVRRLQSAVRSAEGDAERHALQCALGHALRADGRAAEALSVLAAVPPGAACGPRAAFDRADLLVALGRADEAAALYAEVGADRLGDGRDREVAERLRALIGKLLQQTGPDGSLPLSVRQREVALTLQLLSLTLPEDERLAHALEAGERALGSAGPLDPPRRDLAVRVWAVAQPPLLEGTLDAETDARARLVAARLLGGVEGLALLEPLPETPEVNRARALVTRTVNRQAGFDALEAALDQQDDRPLRAALAAELRRDDQTARARAHLAALAEGDDEHAEAAMLALAEVDGALAQTALQRAEAELAHYGAFLDRFPASSERARVEDLRAQAWLDGARASLAAGDAAGALARYDAFLAAHPAWPRRGEVAWEAGEAARQAGQLDEARDRWEACLVREEAMREAMASLVALRAEQDGAAAALAWLEGRGRGDTRIAEVARAEKDRRDAPSLCLEAGPLWLVDDAAPVEEPGRRETTVRLHVRNLDALTLRLHRVDAEAVLRSGGSADTLPSLDVAVIAPDREWPVTLPPGAPGIDRTVEVPVKLPGPGLYALTAATDTEQAQVVLRSGGGRAIAHGAAKDLVVAVLDGDRPDPGARVLVASGDRVLEGRTGRDGLARFTVPDGQVRVLAEGRGGPSLLDLSWSAVAPSDALRVQADLDRPAVAPGDALGFRVVGRRGDAPITGAWWAWLRVGGVDGVAQKVQADGRGSLVGELSVPPVPPDLADQVELVVRAVDAEQELVAGRAKLAEPAGPRSRRLAVDRAGDGAVVRVEDHQGAPLAGAVVEIMTGDGEAETRRVGPDGRLALDEPAAPVLRRVRLPGSGWRVVPEAEAPAPLELSAPDAQPLPDAPWSVRLDGPPGRVTLRLTRAPVALDAPEAPISPLTQPAAQPLVGPRSWTGDRDPQVDAAHSSVALPAPPALPAPVVVELTGDGPTTVSMAGLPAGRWTLRAVPDDPRAASQQAELSVAEPEPRLGPVAASLPPGATVPVALDRPALLIVEAAAGIAQATLARGETRVTMPERHGAVRLVAVDARGRSSRVTRLLDGVLDVELETARDGDRLGVTLSVRDPDGAPARAQVAVRLLDPRLLEQVSAGGTSTAWLWGATAPKPSAGAWGGPLLMAADSEAISGALLAEKAREAEKERRQAAGRGELQSGRLASIMADEEPMEGFGGLGTSGYGSGGGGYGSGRGLGTAGKAAGRSSPGQSGLGPAILDRVLWRVVETGTDGTARLDVSELPPGPWVVEARALTDRFHGEARDEVAAQDTAWLAAPTLSAAAPGEQARPRVTVVQPGDAPLRVVVEVGDQQQETVVPARGAVAVSTGPLAPGASTAVRLRVGGVVVGETSVEVPVLAPAVASETGRLVRVALGARGAPPLLGLLAEHAPSRDPGALARWGRMALAASSTLRGDAAAAAAQQADDALHALRVSVRRGQRPASALDQAQVVAFLAEAQARRPLLAITSGEIDAAVQALAPLPRDSRDRVAQTWALAVAGRPVDQPGLGRLLREADALDADTRAWLALALVALGRPDDAPALIEGDSAHAILARRALGPAAGGLPAGGLPPVGDPDRAAAFLALAGAPRASGAVTVRVNGEAVATLDASAGGEVRLVVAATDAVEAPGAVLLRGEPHAGAAPLRVTLRPQGAHGQPLPVAGPPTESCGAEADPCSLRVGDALSLGLVGARPGAGEGAGLTVDGALVTAVQPGRYAVTGLEVRDRADLAPAAPLWVDVRPVGEGPTGGLDPARLRQDAALALAWEAHALGQDPEEWLRPWPAFDDWSPARRPGAMALRWEEAQDAGAAERVAAFEALRDADPSASLSLPEVARVAEAYAEQGQHGRSVEVWQAGLGAAFLGEAAPLRRMEATVGRLPSLQALQLLPLRYPSVPVVDEAEFHLPERLAALIDEGLPSELLEEGITPTDVRLLAAAWDRRFLAFHPDSEFAPQAGFHLAQALLRLDAWGPAADQAARTAAASPDAPVRDGLAYVEGVARSELGQTTQARRLFSALAEGTDWPDAQGGVGPAALRPDARYALARLDEAAGRTEAAAEAYGEVAGTFPEAAQARQALQRVVLDAEPQRLLDPGEAATLTVQAANLDTVFLRAYRLDLRTVFLRDGGLRGVRSVQVSGVSPAWSGSRRVGVGPYPEERVLDLPLLGPGAWLVEVDGAGAVSRALVVRSALSLDAQDGAAGRRVVVRRGGDPAPGVDLRALVSGGAEAARTDVRGVALVASGAPVLAFSGDHVAFSDPLVAPPSRRPAPEPSSPDLYRNLDRRIQKQRDDNNADFERIYQLEQTDEIDANRL